MSRRIRAFRHVPALLLIAAVPAALHGQASDSLAAHARVRVHVLAIDSARSGGLARLTSALHVGRSEGQPLIGSLAAADRHRLLMIVRPGSEPLSVPRATVQALYLSRGRPSRLEAGLRGTVVPALTSAAISAVVSSIWRDEGDPTPAQAAASSAMWGALWGFARGAWSPPERWQRVTLSETGSMTVAGRGAVQRAR